MEVIVIGGYMALMLGESIAGGAYLKRMGRGYLQFVSRVAAEPGRSLLIVLAETTTNLRLFATRQSDPVAERWRVLSLVLAVAIVAYLVAMVAHYVS